MIYTAPCIMFWMGAYILRGEVEGGWALEFPSFLGPVKWERADRRVPFGAQQCAGPVCLSRIPNPKTATKARGKGICCPSFFLLSQNHKIETCFIFEQVKKALKNMGLGSEIRYLEKTYSGSRIRICNTLPLGLNLFKGLACFAVGTVG